MSAIPAEVRDRVITAAVELYEQAGHERFPTVDAVRRLSRADMNTVCAVMKEWRQVQTMQAAPVVVAVPEAIQQANAAAVAALWLNATELANQSLRSAQAGWEKERIDLDNMRAELADSYESQAAELETTKKQLAESEAKTAEQGQALATVRQSEAEALHRAERAEARAADLRGELDRAISEIDRQRAELNDARAKADVADQWHQEQRKQAAERMTKTEADRDAAREQANAAREDAAKLHGQLEAMQTQAASLIKAMTDRQQEPQAEVVKPEMSK